MPALGLDVILLGLGVGSEFVLQHPHHALENYWASHYEALFTLRDHGLGGGAQRYLYLVLIDNSRRHIEPKTRSRDLECV